MQWRTARRHAPQVLVPTVTGTGEGMAFDASGNLYVTRWCIDGPCVTGNAVEKFNNLGHVAGQGRTGVQLRSPHDPVRLAARLRHGLRRPGGLPAVDHEVGADGTTLAAEYMVAEENHGVFWMDLAPDGCTMFYTSFGPNVKRYDVCTNTQLADFNAAPLPGGMAQDLRVLPDGGVLVSSGQVIARLNAVRRRHPDLRGAGERRPLGRARSGRRRHVLGRQLLLLERLQLQSRRRAPGSPASTPARRRTPSSASE